MTATAVVASNVTDPHGRGRELGATRADGLRRMWAIYSEIFAEARVPEREIRVVADEARIAVEDWAPHLADEIAGIAEGSGLEAWQVFALNARSEVLTRAPLPGPGECSTSVVLVPGEAPRTVQTWDWHELVVGNTVAWRFTTAAGRTVTTFTELGLLAKIGVTDAGLGVHFNLLQHDADGGPSGVPVHVVARRLLEEATDLESAERLLRSARVSASVSLTVVTWDGRRGEAASFELSPAGLRRVEPVEGVLLHTNHFLAPAERTSDKRTRETHDSENRLARLRVRADQLGNESVDVRAEAMLCHADEGAALCRHPRDEADPTGRWVTVATLALDLAGSALVLRDGTPCNPTGPWRTVSAAPQRVR